ncbi:zinc finger, CCHC-type containing protein [Tanacetum coccineum]
MAAAAMKHMASSFAKLEKFEGVDFRRWQKKMHFLLSSMSVVYVLTTLMPDDGGENPTVEQVRKRAKWDNDDYVCRGLILNGMSDSLFDVYQNVETSKEPWDTLEAKYMAEDALSKKFLVTNFTNYKMTDSRPVLEQYNELLGILGRFTQHNMNMDESIKVSCIIDKLPPSWKDFKHTLKHLKDELTLIELGIHLRIEESLKAQDNDKPKGKNVVGPSVVNMKCGKPGHFEKDCKGGNVGNRANRSGTKGSEDGSSYPLKGQSMFNKSHQIYHVTYVYEAFFVQDNDVAWWVDSGATVHILGNESTTLVHGRGCVDLRFSSRKVVSLLNVLHVPNIRKNLVSSSVLNNYGYKQVIESNKFVLSKHGVFIGFGYLSNHMFRLNIVSDNIGSAFMSTSKLNDSILWHARLGHVHFKRMQDMSKDGLIPAFDMDTEKCQTCMLNKITKKPFQNVKRETEVLELIHSDLCDLHATPSLGNKKYFVTFIDDASRFCYVYLLHSKDEALDKFKVFKTEVELQQGSLIKRFRTDRGGEYMDTLAVVRLPDLKLKTLGERDIECIFVGYAKHSKAYRFYVIEPNDSVAINSIIESRDAIFDEHRFSSVPRPSQRSLEKGTKYSSGSVVPERTSDEIVQQSEPQLRKSKRQRTPKDFGPEFQLYLIEGTRDKVSDQHSYCFNVEDDPKTFDKAMKSQDVAFWKEAINDEMDSIMGNNTWALIDLPPGCRPLGCKWIFKRKLNVDGTVKKFKARLVIQGFKQKSGIDYFDTYAPVARISTIRLLIAMTSIHSLIIHQMDVKTTFLNGELEDEVYMNQPLGFILPGNKNKVNLTKEFLSSRFSMKDMGEADVILGIRIKHESNGTAISQSHYIEKVLKKFNYSDCTPVGTPLDTCEKLMPNRGLVVSQLEYSRVIGCLMYAMTCTRPDIAFAVDWYTMDILQCWISNNEDNSSTSGWVFPLGGGAIFWASKKQTCITGSTMEPGFVALASAGKEAEWLKNLLLEIPLWVKPMAPIFIRCDSAATLAKAYSQMYNGKSRHLGVRHSMIRELITNRVVSIEFVRSQQNLADHLTKGLARDLVIKSAKGMGLKSNQVAEC